MSSKNKLIQFEPWHLKALNADRLMFDLDSVTPEIYQHLIDAGPCRTVVCGYKIVVCSGVIAQGNGVGKVWSLVTIEPGLRKLLTATRFAMQFFNDLLETPEYERLEITVEDDYDQGHIWARRLGFTHERVFEDSQDGIVRSLYSRFSNGTNRTGTDSTRRRCASHVASCGGYLSP